MEELMDQILKEETPIVFWDFEIDEMTCVGRRVNKEEGRNAN